ncbi:MAG: radical SAM protein, partial [Thermoplasmata archaeon]
MQADDLRLGTDEPVHVVRVGDDNLVSAEVAEEGGLQTMDPLGLGPVSMSFTNGGVMTPYTKASFEDLVLTLPN